jgi:hypothetical protein
MNHEKASKLQNSLSGKDVISKQKDQFIDMVHNLIEKIAPSFND